MEEKRGLLGTPIACNIVGILDNTPSYHRLFTCDASIRKGTKIIDKHWKRGTRNNPKTRRGIRKMLICGLGGLRKVSLG